MKIRIPRVRGPGRCLLSTAALIALTACAPAQRASDISALQTKGAIIEVRNDRFEDIVVYFIRGGTQIALGVVPGLSRHAFAVSPAYVGGGGSVALGQSNRSRPRSTWLPAA